MDLIARAMAAKKADKTYVDTQLSAVNEGPKGVYASLTDLQTAFPTGDSHIYLITADGKWYYWSGSAWTAGGTYQATGISNGSIAPLATVFMKQSANLFNKNTASANTTISTSTGATSAATGYYVSDFIPVDLSTDYIKTHNGNIVFFDASKTYISGQSLSLNTPIVSPSNAAYARVSLYDTSSNLSNLNSFMFVSGTSLPADYVPYYFYFDKSNTNYPLVTFDPTDIPSLSITNDKFDYGSLSPDKAQFFAQSGNLFNANTGDNNNILNANTGTIGVFTDYFSSDYIPVTAGSTYICNKTIVDICYYDKTKTFQSGSSTHINSNTAFTIPSNCDFIKISIYNPSTDPQTVDCMLMAGTVMSAIYIPYNFYLAGNTNFPLDLSHSNWTRKVGAALGDSNTANQRWQQYIIDALGLSPIQNCGIGGTRMSGTDPNAMWQDVRVNAISVPVDFVFIMAGTNDSASNAPIGTIDLSNTDTTTFVGAYNTCLSKIYARCGNAVNIFLITPLPAFNSSYSTNLQSFVDATREIGKLWALPVIDVNANIQLNNSNYQDYYEMVNSPIGVHINYDGGKKFATVAVGVLKANEPIS